jgi:DNA-binding NtrC family response regulator
MSGPESTIRIALVEDEALFAKAVERTLNRHGYETTVFGSLSAAAEAVPALQPDLMLLDMRLPDGSGLDYLERLRGDKSAQAVVVMTAFGDLENAVAAMKLGALDYLKKPIDMDDLVHAVDKALEQVQLTRRLGYSRQREARGNRENTLLGENPQIVELREEIAHIGAISTRTDEPPPTVLILAETGCGKDLVARALHDASARRDRPFVQVDCAALPDELIESELFGHEKGAFTSAHRQRSGLIEAAEDGTVFLDEIGELPLDLQAKLLAVLERRKVRAVGSTRERDTQAWFIAATNRDLNAMVANGAFRSDLYFRLNIVTLSIPPLRERGGDVQLLARHFAAQATRRYGVTGIELKPEIIDQLDRYAWPGNVRELAHVMERAVLLSRDGNVTAAQLALAPPRDTASAEAALDNLTLEEAELRLIRHALQRTRGNVSEAARRLGVTRMTMRHRIKKYGLDDRDS